MSNIPLVICMQIIGHKALNLAGREGEKSSAETVAGREGEKSSAETVAGWE